MDGCGDWAKVIALAEFYIYDRKKGSFWIPALADEITISVKMNEVSWVRYLSISRDRLKPVLYQFRACAGEVLPESSFNRLCVSRVKSSFCLHRDNVQRHMQ